MASPIFNQTPRYFANAAVADVQSIIDDLRVILLAIGWTEPVANSFKNPPDAFGRFMTLAFSRVSATDLNMVATDHLGRSTGTNKMQISGTVTVKYFYGIGYLHIVNVTPATAEWIQAAVMVLSPEPENAHNGYLWTNSLRNNAAALVGNNRSGIVFSFSTNAYPALNPNVIMLPITGAFSANPSVQMTPAGFRRWFPVIMTGIDADGAQHIRGRIPNLIYMTGNAAQPGNRYTVSIDEATTSSFEVLPIRDTTNPAGTAMAVRVP